MIYRVIDDEQAVSQAVAVLDQHWQQGAQKVFRKVSWRRWKGESAKEYTVWWREQEKIWGCFELDHRGLYEIFFGLSINQPRLKEYSQFVMKPSAVSPQYGGVFLSHSSGKILLGHTGKVGGGSTGVGRHNFLAYCKGKTDIIEIEWPDGKQTEGFVMAEITSPHLPAQIRLFTELVLEFKKSVK
jgi:hypothetical protein